MSNQRPSFAKRDREMKLKDKARQKAERRAFRNNNPTATKGPPMATADEVAAAIGGPIVAAAPVPAAAPPQPDTADTRAAPAQPSAPARSRGALAGS